jgi:hypothetical protein
MDATQTSGSDGNSLEDVLEDLVVERRARERLAADTGHRTSLRETAEQLGVDLDNL